MKRYYSDTVHSSVERNEKLLEKFKDKRLRRRATHVGLLNVVSRKKKKDLKEIGCNDVNWIYLAESIVPGGL
jgi:IS5 family transposase